MTDPKTTSLRPAATRPARIDRARSVLIVIDLQQRLLPHIEAHEAILARTEALVALAVAHRLPRLATEHCAARIGPLVASLRTCFDPAEIIPKTCFGAADDPAFVSRLDATGRDQIVVAGVEAHVCVLQTVLGLRALDRSVFVAADAVGSRSVRQGDCELALSRMREAGCTLAGTETILFEWARRADDDRFAQTLQAVKALPAG
jgi:nicotinamidase-related amidase